MKFNIILATICLALGAAIAWVAKPDPADAIAQTESRGDQKPSKTPDASSTPEKREVSERKIVESERTPQAPLETDGVEVPDNRMQNRMSEMFKKRQMAKMDARISKLVAQLNLTPEQEAALRKAVEGNMAGLDGLMSGNADSSRLREMIKGDGIDEALAEILTPEQKEEHEEVKKRELANKVEAKALKNLAKLSNLDLTQEQKDAAYDILYKQAEGSVTADFSENGMISVITSGLGIELDGDDLGFATTFVPEIANQKDAEDGGIVTPNPKDMMARMKENQTKQIDKKVEALRPVLNESQLEQYRKDLELKSGGLFGGFMGGFDVEVE